MITGFTAIYAQLPRPSRPMMTRCEPEVPQTLTYPIRSKGPYKMTTTNRRRYQRANAEIACKCRRSAHTLFAPAQTIDLSPGGASLEITSPRLTKLGDRLALAFNSPTCPILNASKMIGATVVRITPIDNNKQHIAVEFDAPQFNLTELATPQSKAA